MGRVVIIIIVIVIIIKDIYKAQDRLRGYKCEQTDLERRDRKHYQPHSRVITGAVKSVVDMIMMSITAADGGGSRPVSWTSI